MGKRNAESTWNLTNIDDRCAVKVHGEATFVIIKPDAVARGLIGRILSRFEDRGLEILAMRMHLVSEDEAKNLYIEHRGKEFLGRVIEAITSGPSIIMVLRGNRAISVVRTMMGTTDCTEALPGTIRGDFGLTSSNRTLVHASRTPEDFEREWHIFDWHSDAFRTPYRVDQKAVYSEVDE